MSIPKVSDSRPIFTVSDAFDLLDSYANGFTYVPWMRPRLRSFQRSFWSPPRPAPCDELMAGKKIKVKNPHLQFKRSFVIHTGERVQEMKRRFFYKKILIYLVSCPFTISAFHPFIGSFLIKMKKDPGLSIQSTLNVNSQFNQIFHLYSNSLFNQTFTLNSNSLFNHHCS